MTPFYQHLVRNFGLDKQTYTTFMKNIPPSTVNLNYESINNNGNAPDRRHYDYCVKDEVSLAKLFMKPFMAQFNAFDSSFDASSALTVLCRALPFASVKSIAEDVRSKVRNEWAHCDFAIWTMGQFDTCFDLMEALVTNMGIPPTDEERILGELRLWRTQGTILAALTYLIAFCYNRTLLNGKFSLKITRQIITEQLSLVKSQFSVFTL